MRILAIETSTRTGDLALLEGEQPIARDALAPHEPAARWLIPRLVELTARVGWRLPDVQLIAVAVGPGSFTGLRVGVATAKALAYGLEAELLGVQTLEALAAQAWQAAASAPTRPSSVWAAADAQRGQLCVQCFRPATAERLEPAGSLELLDAAAWLARLQPGELLVGPGLRRVQDRLPAQVRLAPADSWRLQAVTVGRLAWRRRRAGVRGDLWRLTPIYGRPSAAEEKAAASRRP